MMRERFHSIQYLRAFAALAVVFHHARNPHPWLFPALKHVELGQCGVDLFFVISGFIMYVAARNLSVAEFVRRRLVRIVPLYWIATLLFLLLTIGRPLDLTELGKSLLFVPSYSSRFPAFVFPVLVQGWSLNYELFFYGLFAIGLFTRTLAWTAFAIVVLVAIGLLYQSGSAIWLTYTNPLLLEFLAGLTIARYRERLTRRWLVLLPLGVALLLLNNHLTFDRALVWGVPCAFIVAGAVAAERNNLLPQWRFGLLLGDASYAMYLFHTFAIAAVGVVIQMLPVGGPAQLLLMLCASIVVTTIVSIIVHMWIEKPILRRLNGLAERTTQLRRRDRLLQWRPKAMP